MRPFYRTFTLLIITLFLGFGLFLRMYIFSSRKCQNNSIVRKIDNKARRMKDKLSIHLLKESNDKIYYYLHSIEDSFQYAHNCLNNEPNEKYKEMAYGTNQMTLLVALVDNSRIIDSKTYTDILQVFKTQFNFFDSDTSKTNPIDFQVIRNIFLSNNEITTKLLVNKLNRYDHISEEKIDKSN